MSNTVYLLIGWIGSIIFNLIFQLVAAKTLLPEELGVLTTAISFVAILSSILIFGMEQTTQRLASFYSGKNRIEYLRSILWFFLVLTIFLNLVVIVSLLLFSSNVSQIFKIPKNIFFICIFILLPFSISFFYAGILRGYQNMRYLTITAIIGDFMKVLVAVVLVIFGYKIFGFFIGYAISILTIFLLRLINIRLFITKFKIPNFDLIVKYAIPSFITQIFWLLLLSGQYLIITIVRNTYDTGLFTVGMILANQIYYIPRIISDALFPITSRLSGNINFIKQQRNLLNLALRYSFLVSLPLLFFISIFPKPLIILIGRPSFLPSANIIPILVTASLFFGVATLLSRTLYAIGKTMTFQTISIIFIIFYLAVSIILTYLLSSLGTSLSYLMTTILMTIVSLYYLKKYISFNIDLRSIAKIFISSFLTFSVLYMISFYVPNLIIGGILTLIFSLIYLIILYFLKFYNQNEIKILDFLSEKIPFTERYAKLVKVILLKKIKDIPQKNE